MDGNHLGQERSPSDGGASRERRIDPIHAFRELPRAESPHPRWLRALHDGLARDFSASVSELLRTSVQVRVARVDQRTYGEFVYNLETPACFYILKADPLPERLSFDIEPAILYPMIDRLLGGGPADEPPLRRPLSDIEQRLSIRIVRRFLETSRRAWAGVADLDFDVVQTESNPRLLRVLSADEWVFLVRFELTLDELRGAMSLCLPCRAVERIAGESPVGGRAATFGHADGLTEIAVTLSDTPIAIDELAELRVGDLIDTETPLGSSVVVRIDGTAKYRARPGVHRGRKAVVISETIDDDQPPLAGGPLPVE
jgi:flagellar motor switch protein FliM